MPEIEGLNSVVSWPDHVPVTDWRKQPDPDPDDEGNDEDIPTPQYVIDILGFDPDEL